MRRFRGGGTSGGVLLVALGLGTGAPLAAQEPARLTLDDAIEIARFRNPEARRATNELARNQPEKMNLLFTELLPHADINLFSTGFNGNLQRQTTDNFGNPLASPAAQWVYFSDTRQGLDLTWNIQGSSLFNAFNRQKNSVEARDRGVESAIWTVRADVQREFFDAMEQQELIAVEEALLEGRRVDHESASRRFELAGASQVDVLDAEVEVAQQEITIERQRGEYEQALLTLRQTLGGAEVPGVEPEPLPLFDPAVLDEDELVELARRMNPGVRTAEADVEGARIGVRESGEDWWPDLTLAYSISRTSRKTDTEAVFDFDPSKQELGQNFFIRLELPAFNDLFGLREDQASARVELANQEVTLDQERVDAEAEVRSNLVALRNEWRALQIAERQAAIAERSAALAREEFRLGTRTFDELRTTVDQEADARRQALTNRYTFVDALLDLEESVGVPVRPGGR
ncbi:MAG: TolC family protein [Longimicrobiales bacterium]|nr:TolC family protein [Longimicrobiales bacterium]